jgi:hypothetical protein
VADDIPPIRPALPAGVELTKLGSAEQLGGDAAEAATHTQLFRALGDKKLPELPGTGRPVFQPERPTLWRRLKRWGPLALLLVCATTLVVTAGAGGMDADVVASGASADRDLHDRRIRLPRVDATFGLSEDNKEVVLGMCWRVSGNPNIECRRAWLTDRGEFPATVQSVAALEVDAFEVSNARYDACVASSGCVERERAACKVYTMRGYALGEEAGDDWFADDVPAVCVTYDEAQTFCEASLGRLPTTHEWERVARAGDDRLQPWGQFWSPGLLNWGERDLAAFPIAGRLDGTQNTAPVTAYEDGATPDGVQQVFGNAAEWVTDAEGEPGVRGGDYTSDLSTMRATYHVARDADERRSTVGFRCVYPL